MVPYREWSPTQFDSKGLGSAALDGQVEWHVVGVMRTRDSGPREQSNFESAWQAISDASVNDNEASCDSHRFGHWGPGWFEIILVRPGSAAYAEAEKVEASLASYPILDESDCSRREEDAANEAWQHTCMRERIEMLADRGISIFAARRESYPDDGQGAIRDRLLGY